MPIVRFFARTASGPITIKLWNERTLDQVGEVAGYSATEHASVKTLYQTASIALAGSWIITAVDANGETLSGFCTAAFTDTYVYAEGLAPGVAAQLVDRLRSQVVYLRTPLNDDGELELIRGDTNDGWVNPVVSWTVSCDDDLSDATATLTVKVKGSKYSVAGTITAAGGDLWTIAFAPAIPDSFPVGPGLFDWQLTSADETQIATPVLGVARVKLDVTRPASS